ERTWPLHLVRELKLVAEIFANALMRDKRDLELDNYRKDLEKMVDKRTAELKETQKELVLSEKMATLGRLTATVSHELRNPLGTIRSSVFSVQKRYKGQDDKLVTALDRAERNIKRCDLIIDELLNYSRVQDLKLEPTSIDEWLSEVLEETIPPAGIYIKKELESKSVINMDQERFRRSIVNILTNAYQAIEEKGGNEPGYVHAFTYKEGENLIIEIADNGVGFDMKNKNRIFEPLYSTKTFGVGLGVSITKQIIEQHGWFMDISGEPKKGATVIITIPLDKNIKSYFGGH
ncbi:MAG: HAMP domain-containing histidine kinase, partial [Deltaproteobacteria bacterium]|nr:HAMP domain-containing histidine kinase [Deltaproteobacteria bacterium]